jgi:hypothetical protein
MSVVSISWLQKMYMQRHLRCKVRKSLLESFKPPEVFAVGVVHEVLVCTRLVHRCTTTQGKHMFRSRSPTMHSKSAHKVCVTGSWGLKDLTIEGVVADDEQRCRWKCGVVPLHHLRMELIGN